ncbi:MAG: hypothetical protein V1837_07895 [Candidatus Woesearchaeota archaeon]
MSYYLFANILGNHVFDESVNLVASGDTARYNCLLPSLEMQKKFLAHFKNPVFFPVFHEKNMLLTRQALKDAVGPDSFIIQATSAIEELDKHANGLVKRLREWYELYNPELSREIPDNLAFVQQVCLSPPKPKDSAGADLTDKDLSPIVDLAKSCQELFTLRQSYEAYLESILKNSAPNLLSITGALIGAKLICRAGSLKHLSEIPASTVQLLGAEKALFRHMRTGARPPKYGILYQHQLIQRAGKQMQGKAARLLADKISIAAKVDYFKGEFVGDKLFKDIEKKMKK